MRTSLLRLTVLLFVLVQPLAASGGPQYWTGWVSDNHCAWKHTRPGGGRCVALCVEGGAKFVLCSGGKMYQLEPQDKFKDFAGKKVKVTGAITGDVITASSVEAVREEP
jgi:hypothetical protein